MIVSTGVLLAGCSELGLKNAMGYGKYSPDETQVHANQSLAMPPSLQLRPPSGTRTSSAAAAPPQPNNLLASQQVTANPPEYGAPDPNAAPQVYAAEPAQPQTLASANPQPVIDQTPTAAPDVYDRVGISKVHPDGTPKTKGELINDLRKYKVAQERKKNPNYGTVFNSGNIVWE
ncbi:MAG: hypothetical protein ACR2OM_01215 [Aestuariivirgaceae bacterium]